MKKAKPKAGDEMLPEYDFRGGVRGKYAGKFRQGSERRRALARRRQTLRRFAAR